MPGPFFDNAPLALVMPRQPTFAGRPLPTMFISPSPLQPRLLFRLVGMTLLVALLWQISWLRVRAGPSQYSTPASPDWDRPRPASEDSQPPCMSPGSFEDIFLVLRTGASEALQKLPAHFNSTLRCVPQSSYGIWSDLEEVIGGRLIQNALNEIDPDIIANNPDFAYYRRLQDKGRDAFSTQEIAQWDSTPNSASGRDTPGWKLDKWKFLPLAERAYRQRPDAKWYIFMEADGHINWNNMLSWLSRVDHSKRYYIGQLMIIGDVIFAYGGASFVISNPAMKALVEHRAVSSGVYENFTSHHWAGDCVLGKALKDIDVDFTQAWPNFLGDSPFDVDYGGTVGGTDARAWCYAAITWHHLSSSDIKELLNLEQQWNLQVRH